MELKRKLELLKFLEECEKYTVAVAQCVEIGMEDFIELKSIVGIDYSDTIKGLEELIEEVEGVEYYPYRMFTQLQEERHPNIDTMVYLHFRDFSDADLEIRTKNQ